MKKLMAPLALAGLLGFAVSAQATGVEHFKGLPAETLEQAVANFAEYNQKLATVLSGEIDNQAMVEVHELTYTLENALEKIHAEVAELVDTLEELHLASEAFDAEAVKAQGDAYLSVATQIVK
ncbi:MAG: DUF6746 family protein [Nitrincola lacisaponensis]|uniref:Uncharacterized protein n=1 Tax=Nitrincola lacisaponensis TaxID=267850 RepID=A0A063Y1N9_9GAMM|nr:DUF6746 family protein [Nitrincola lacisaponensis]KDE40238.1 hypothetical protein ADINL_0830 [Nitrincola lacisaponensis]